MIYLLDTNTCIYLLKNNPPEVAERFSELHQDEVVISAITWAELCCGLNTHTAEPILNALRECVSVLPFNDKAAQIYGELTQKFPNRKGNFDRLIAAHAIALDAVLVSNNVADFRMYDLTVENWVKEYSE